MTGDIDDTRCGALAPLVYGNEDEIRCVLFPHTIGRHHAESAPWESPQWDHKWSDEVSTTTNNEGVQMTDHEVSTPMVGGELAEQVNGGSSPTDPPELDDVASRALASIILERTSDAINDDGAGAGEALLALEGDTGLPLDVCAGILYVTSWFAGMGGIEAVAIFAASVALQPDETDAS